MFRLLVVGKNDAIANEAAEWAVSGEKMGETYEKKYELSGRSISLKALPFWVDKIGTKPVGDGLLLVCKTPEDLPAMEPVVQHYLKMPIKFILYCGTSDQTEYEVKWAAKGIQKAGVNEFVEQLITANNELVKLIATVFNSFDKDHSGYIELAEIRSMAKELGSEIPEAEAKQIIEELDRNKDGKISLEEFVEWWKTGRQGKSTKMGGLLEDWLKKNPAFKKVVEVATALKEAAEEPENLVTGSFELHVNRVKSPGLAFGLEFLTRGKDLDAEFQAYSGAVGLTPKEPFVGLGFGAKNPKDARAKLEDIANAAIMMSTSLIPPAAEALSNVDFKYGETTNKVFVCAAPSSKGSTALAPILASIAPFCGIILPQQAIKFCLSFATDLNQLASEDKPFYELLLDGISLQVKSQINPKLYENAQTLLTQTGMIGLLPAHIKHTIVPALHMDQWLKCGKGEIEFEVDQALKDTIKEIAGPTPASMPLKDLKMMFAGQAQEMISALPIAEMVHTFFKEEVESIEIFIYLSDIVGIKLSLKLPGLGALIAI